MQLHTPIVESFEELTPSIGENVYLAAGSFVIGDVHIGANSSIWYGCVLRGDDHYIRIGEGTNIQDGTVVHVTLDTNPTIVGDRVVVGHKVCLHGCEIGDDALVGMGSIVLDGAVMEAGSMLAAGSLLTPNKRVPSGELWGGSPARKMRDMTEADYAYIKWDIDHYQALAKRYLARLPDVSY